MVETMNKYMFSLVFIISGSVHGCTFLQSAYFKAVGTTKAGAELGRRHHLLSVVTYGPEWSKGTNSKDKISYTTDSSLLINLDAYLMIDYPLKPFELLRQAAIHTAHSEYKSKTIFCVLSQSNVAPNKTLFLDLWQSAIYYVVVEIRNGTNYIFNPFQNEVISVDGDWNDLKSRFAQVWKNMMGMKIKVSVIQENLSFTGRRESLGGGLDSSFLYEFSRYHNFSTVIINDKSYKSSNVQVWQHQAEIGINTRFITSYEQKLELSYVAYGELVCLVVRKKNYVGGWDVFQNLFHTDAWIFICAGVLVINTILTILCRRLRWLRWLPITMSALFSVPLPPLTKETKEKFLIGSCFVFSLIFTSYVQATYIEILKGKIPVTFPSEELVYKYVAVMRDTPFTGDFTVMRQKEFTLSAFTGLVDPSKYLTMCPDYTRNMAYAINFGSFIGPHLNKFVIRAFEAGLPDAWYSKTMSSRRRRVIIEDAVKVLGLRDCEIAFYELLCGLSISFVVFIAEIIFGKFTSIQNRLNEVKQ